MKHGYGFFSQFFDPGVARRIHRHAFEFQFGPGWGRQGRRGARRGQIRFLVLEALEAGPKHGYEIMTAIEQTRGFRPSPGSIYPTLQMLEDAGFVTSAERDGKRVYTLTESGRQHLDEHAAAHDAADDDDDEDGRPDARHQLRASSVKLAAAVMGARHANEESTPMTSPPRPRPNRDAPASPSSRRR